MQHLPVRSDPQCLAHQIASYVSQILHTTMKVESESAPPDLPALLMRAYPSGGAAFICREVYKVATIGMSRTGKFMGFVCGTAINFLIGIFLLCFS